MFRLPRRVARHATILLAKNRCKRAVAVSRNDVTGNDGCARSLHLPRKKCGTSDMAPRSVVDSMIDDLGDRLAGGQARRLDADQVDQLRRAVAARLLDHEVADRLAGALQLGPDAGVAG